MIGANLTRMDTRTLRLLTNPEVLAVDQHSRGASAAYRSADMVAWLAAPARGSGQYVAVFNLGATRQWLDAPWSALGLRAPVANLRDRWLRKDLGPQPRLPINLAAHASAV